MATARLKSILLKEVLEEVLYLVPCADAQEWLERQPDDMLAFNLWRTAPLEYLDWISERLDLRLSLGYHAICDAQCEEARSVLDKARSDSELRYEGERNQALGLEDVFERDATLETIRRNRALTDDYAYDDYGSRTKLAEDQLYRSMRSYTAFRAAYKALMIATT